MSRGLLALALLACGQSGPSDEIHCPVGVCPSGLECMEGECVACDGEGCQVAVALQSRELDVLFVIADTAGMGPKQAALAAAAPAIFTALEGADGTLPSLHVGVVSTDLGAGEACPGDGLMGNLQASPRIDGCPAPFSPFIDYREDALFGTVQNFTGALPDAFACIAQLGTSGCPFSRPLDAVARAFLPGQPWNVGFRRPAAKLAIVFVTDQDDCSSFGDVDLFVADETMLGPQTSFRCAEYGLVCGGQPIGRTPMLYDPAGPPSLCAPDSMSTFLRDPLAYLGSLQAQAVPGLLFFGFLEGGPDPVEVALDALGRPALAPACSSVSAGTATPAVRLHAIADAWPGDRTGWTSICDLGAGVPALFRHIGELADLRCLSWDAPFIADPVTADCRVFYQLADRVDVLPHCPQLSPTELAPDPPAPCWWLRSEPSCFVSMPLALEIVPGADPLPPDSELRMTCVVRDAP